MVESDIVEHQSLKTTSFNVILIFCPVHQVQIGPDDLSLPDADGTNLKLPLCRPFATTVLASALLTLYGAHSCSNEDNDIRRLSRFRLLFEGQRGQKPTFLKSVI